MACSVWRSVGAEASDIASFLYGTTITTNALIEMKGVPVGLLLTAACATSPKPRAECAMDY
jgi:N-methylhydantoinase A/oxoprolinase/acetone carboxylase beta subunit